jgi:hypothetical protein
VWVEGQITQISSRPGARTAFLTLRDPSADISMTVTCDRDMLSAGDARLSDGARVVVHAKPTYFVGRGTLSLRAREIRAVGVGELLARIERLRKLLAAEGRLPDRVIACVGGGSNALGMFVAFVGESHDRVRHGDGNQRPAVGHRPRECRHAPHLAMLGNLLRAAGKRCSTAVRGRPFQGCLTR